MSLLDRRQAVVVFLAFAFAYFFAAVLRAITATLSPVLTTEFGLDAGGPHWHQFSCGWQSRELALKAAELACSNAKEDGLIECTPVQLIDEDGKITEPPFN